MSTNLEHLLHFFGPFISSSGIILTSSSVAIIAILLAVLQVAVVELTDCPATFDTLCEGYYSGVGGPTGQFVVYSGRGRFEVFFEVSWIHLS